MDENTYPIWGIYTAGGNESINFIELCRSLKRFTVDSRYFNRGYAISDPTETIIKEVKMLLPHQKIDKKYEGLLGKQEMKLNDMAVITPKLKAALKEYIVSQWNPNEKHLMFHSSGFDSRIVSGILAELRVEKGKDWIGDIHFRCHQPEGAMFERIMKAEGWDTTQYSNFCGPEYDHYDIGRADNPVYGFLPHFLNFNFWRDIVPSNKEKEYTLITGIYGGEMTDYPTWGAKSLGLKFCDNSIMNRWLNYILDRGIYYSQIHEKFKRLILPFCSYSYLQAVTNISTTMFSRNTIGIDSIRLSLLKSFKIDLVNIPYVGHNYNFKYSPERTEHMVSAWKNSRLVKDFGDDNGVKSAHPLEFNPFDASLYGFMTCYEAITGRK